MNPLRTLFKVWQYILINIVLISVHFSFVNHVRGMIFWTISVGAIVNGVLILGDIRNMKEQKINQNSNGGIK